VKGLIAASYSVIGILIAVVTVAAAANLKLLAEVYAWLTPVMKPFAVLPWVQQVATQSHKFPLAEAHAALVLAGLVLIFGTAWLGALPALRETVAFQGTDVTSLSTALRTNFFLRLFIQPGYWRPASQAQLSGLSPGDDLFVNKRIAGFDELLIRYYTHGRVRVVLLFGLVLLTIFLAFPAMLDGSLRSNAVWFFFGRLLIALASVFCGFSLLLFLSACLARMSSGEGLNSST
jgi:hypothetical protein